MESIFLIGNHFLLVTALIVSILCSEAMKDPDSFLQCKCQQLSIDLGRLYHSDGHGIELGRSRDNRIECGLVIADAIDKISACPQEQLHAVVRRRTLSLQT